MNRRSLLLAGTLALLMALLGYSLYPVIVPGDQSSSQYAARDIPNTDLNPFGANFFLEREVEPWKRQETVRMAREAGIRWAKQQFIWAEIEPQPGRYRWDKYDAIVDLCETYGLRIVARLDGAPNWSRQDNSLPGRPPDDLADYGRFVGRFVQHYRGRVRYVQIWNEPNLFIEWGNRPVDPAGYVQMLQIAYQQAKAADPNVYVLSAPLAITLGEPHPEPGKWRAMSDLQYLEEMYKAGAKPFFDILSANAFGMDLPPEDPASAGKLNFARAYLQRRIMEQYGDQRKAVWFNEYGWNAAPESLPTEALIWKRVSEQEQAAFTLQGIEYARQNWPWAGVFFIWYFRQVGDVSPDDAAYYFRMVDVDFSPRRVYLAVKDKAVQLAQAGPGHYEETSSPVAAAPGRWSAQIDPEASGQQLFVSDSPEATLSFTFRGGQVYLIARSGPQAGRLLVTVDGQNAGRLPLDEYGRSYVELYAPQEATISTLVVHDTSPRTRTLRLAVSESAHPRSLGRWCAIDAFQVGKEPAARFPVVPVILLSTGCIIVGWLLGRATARPRPPA